MSLRAMAETDLGTILEDEVFGFGWPISLVSPDSVAHPLTGYSDDISQVVDPETGEIVSGRSASVALRLSTIYAAGLAIPKGVSQTDVKPWLVTFNDINGNPYTFKVLKSNPDRALGMVTLLLEYYEA